MMTYAPRIVCTAIFFTVVCSGYSRGAEGLGVPVQLGDPEPDRVKYWESILPEKPSGVGPTIDDRAAWEEIAGRPGLSEIVTRARTFASMPIPELSDELFLSYSQTGNRRPSERRIRERAEYLKTLVIAECIEDQGEFLPAIERAIMSYDAQKTWLYPAHDPNLENFRDRCGCDVLGYVLL